MIDMKKPLGKNDVMMNKVAGLPVYAFYMSDGWNRVDDLKERCHICGYPANIVWKVKHSEAHQNCRDEYYLCEVCISFVDMLHSFDNFVMRSYIEQTQKRMNESYEQGKKDAYTEIRQDCEQKYTTCPLYAKILKRIKELSKE